MSDASHCWARLNHIKRGGKTEFANGILKTEDLSNGSNKHIRQEEDVRNGICWGPLSSLFRGILERRLKIQAKSIPDLGPDVWENHDAGCVKNHEGVVWE